jgi:hypothetical protein
MYRNMAMGWAISNNTYPKVVMDKDLKLLILEQLKVRSMLRSDSGPWKLMFYEILENEPDKMLSTKALKSFLSTYYQMRDNEIYYRLSMAKIKKVIKQVHIDGKELFELTWDPESEIKCIC